jgi:hypothetical protein
MCVLMLMSEHFIIVEWVVKSLGIDEMKSKLKLRNNKLNYFSFHYHAMEMVGCLVLFIFLY